MDSRSYFPLEPSYFSSLGLTPPTFVTGQPVSLAATTTFLFTLGIMLAIVAAGGVLAWSGIVRMQPSEQAVSKSNAIAKRAILGLFGVLCLYVIIKTFNADLLTGDVGLAGLRSEAVRGGGSTMGVGSVVPTSTTTLPIVNTDGSEQRNRDALAAQGIGVNKAACTQAQMSEARPSCTNLAGLPNSTIGMLVQLKDSCRNASITVTGGTEPGHKSHGPGKSAVDLRIGDPALDNCIRGFVRGPNFNYCNATYTGLGFLFCDEKGTGHWHVYR